MADSPTLGSASFGRVSIARRVLYYGAVWLFAVIAFQVLLKPDGLTESNLGELQQRVRWPLYAPIMATLGLAKAFTWPRDATGGTVFAAAVCFAVHAILTITQSHRRAFVLMICIQAALLVVAVIYFIRFSRLPAGG